MIQRYFSGLRFGMLLQIAIGPMCLMVFNTAKNAGFWVAMSLVLAVALVDAFYIALAALTILPEALRSFADYRMLMYAVILIAVMLVSNNQKIKDILKNAAEKRTGKKLAEGGAADE